MVAVYTLMQTYEFTCQHLWCFFMSLGYPLSPFCFYFAHNSYEQNNKANKNRSSKVNVA
jgi:hypothetical protein